MPLNVTIMTADSILFEGEAESVSSVNDKGPFDILPYHANFISLIKEKIVIKDKSGKDKEFKLKNAVLKAYKNQVSVFMGIE